MARHHIIIATIIIAACGPSFEADPQVTNTSAVQRGGAAGWSVGGSDAGTNAGGTAPDSAETEPNDKREEANPIGATATGSIEPVADSDWFSFEAGGDITIATHDIGSDGCSVDAVITMYDEIGNYIAQDAVVNIGTCAKIDPSRYAAVTGLPHGVYHVKINQITGHAIIPAYQIDITQD